MIVKLARTLLRLRLYQLEKRVNHARFDLALSSDLDRIRAALELLS